MKRYFFRLNNGMIVNAIASTEKNARFKLGLNDERFLGCQPMDW